MKKYTKAKYGLASRALPVSFDFCNNMENKVSAVIMIDSVGMVLVISIGQQ